MIPQQSPAQKAKDAQDKIADDFESALDRMTPEERKAFWKQHDLDTGKDAAQDEERSCG